MSRTLLLGGGWVGGTGSVRKVISVRGAGRTFARRDANDGITGGSDSAAL